MSTFFIADNGHLIEVVEHITAISAFTPFGIITQPQSNYEFIDRGKATEEDRNRIPKDLGGYA